MKNADVLDRIRGALYGVAVGDALGGPVEFMDAGAIEAIHGRLKEMIGGGWLHLAPGEITDDTQMTMAVAQGIAERPSDPVPAIGRRFIEWYASAPKDIGGTCSNAISVAIANNATTTKDWQAAGFVTDKHLHGRTAGNGALMRTIYPAIYYHNKQRRSEMVQLIGRMTHYNEESDAICVEYADAVHAAIFGGHPIATLSRRHYRRNAEPTGYVVDTWSNVIDSICDTETFEAAVVEAVNRGGDADTVGAITGGLAGAYYGYRKIPKRWINALDPTLRKEMDRLAELAYHGALAYYREAKK